MDAGLDLAAGKVLRGKYRIDRVIGKGGMGIVLQATHLDLDRPVAIKVLHPELRVHGELVERFLREGKAASKIQSDNVARVLDVDRLDDGTPFLVMEYLEGTDLSAVRKMGSPLPTRTAIEHVLGACKAIGEAHRRGIVHRDLKPANLFLARLDDGSTRIKVLDFGISKIGGALGGSEPSMTSTSIVMGSAEYMSPEQMLSTRDADARTDIWALGVVLFELLTARVPFPGETLTQVCAMVMSKPAPPVRTFRPDITDDLETVVSRCLEKDRDKRYATVAHFERDLIACRDGTPISLGPSTEPIPKGTGTAGSDHPPRHAPLAVPVDAARSPSSPPHSIEPSDASIANLERSSLGTSVLPTTPVPLPPPHGPVKPWVGASDAPIAADRTGPPTNPPVTRASDAPPRGVEKLVHISIEPSVSGLQPSQTNVPVSSDPIPQPPKTSSKGPLLALGVVLAAALGVGVALFAMNHGPSKPEVAASTPPDTTPTQSLTHSAEPKPSGPVVRDVAPAESPAPAKSSTPAPSASVADHVSPPSKSAEPATKPKDGAPAKPLTSRRDSGAAQAPSPLRD